MCRRGCRLQRRGREDHPASGAECVGDADGCADERAGRSCDEHTARAEHRRSGASLNAAAGAERLQHARHDPARVRRTPERNVRIHEQRRVTDVVAGLQSKARTTKSVRIPQATGNLVPIFFDSIVPSANVTVAGAVSFSQGFPAGTLEYDDAILRAATTTARSRRRAVANDCRADHVDGRPHADVERATLDR